MRCDPDGERPLVGREHEFFDETVREVALGAGDALHKSELVEFDDGLGQVEVDGAAAMAFAVEDEGEIAHQLERRDQRGIALAQGGVVFEDGVHVGVGHALGGADDPFA